MNQSEREELSRLCDEIADLGSKIEARRKRALDIVGGMIATRNGNDFLVRSARVYFGGSATRLFFEGPRLKQDGTPHARTTDAGSLNLIEKLRAGHEQELNKT
jgi:hypothetical protein